VLQDHWSSIVTTMELLSKQSNLDRIKNQNMFHEDITLFVRLSKEVMLRFAK
jgi:hypothetical protein